MNKAINNIDFKKDSRVNPKHQDSIKLSDAKKKLIDKIGPWAFQSFPRADWYLVSDRKIIEGVLLRAKPEHKLMLLELYDLNLIRKVWEQDVVIQDPFFHGVNVWVAENLFNQKEPEKYVKRKYKKASLLNRLGKLL